jgi:hypothetical protein
MDEKSHVKRFHSKSISWYSCLFIFMMVIFVSAPPAAAAFRLGKFSPLVQIYGWEVSLSKLTRRFLFRPR